MHRLFIIGAGGFGREVLAWAVAVAHAQRSWEVAGFLDSNPEALERTSCSVSIVGDPLTYEPVSTDRFICAIGDPVTKLRLCHSLEQRGAKFITLIHPTALVGPRSVIGDGCILCPYSILTADVTIGDHVTVNCYSGAGHDARIGDGTTLSAHCDVTGYAALGEGVFLGSHASVLPGITVGDYARVGAGSVVLRDVRAHTTVMGVPARVILDYSTESH